MFSDCQANGDCFCRRCRYQIEYILNRQFAFSNVAKIVFSAPRFCKKNGAEQRWVEYVQIDMDRQIRNLFFRYPLQDFICTAFNLFRC
ncbi:Uncharacterised protein [Klebsiella pneumoniae]|nr:hypothetical protein AF38_04487 [Klebsiella pneumoniae MGH 52]KMH22050.1 hypothetical protein SM67_00855 [Klebsiella pneumoniae]SBI81870.1 Uncharacterised protein [Klebsiella pneumoniae]SBJ10993.1 Uncharacterised protein [Klebsiella pneumoniae]SBJ53205.1 Uncharacterised protein [Klebsiella pneumoniae]